MNSQETVFPVITLKYRAGDLIIKEGDYGISIYKIVEGKVVIFQESEDEEIALSTLGPDEIFGEIAFLNRAKEIRSASAKALEPSVLEVWHPSILLKEYEQMPPMLKYVADQILSRLLRMNKLIVQLTIREQNQRKGIKKQDPLTSQRRYYRKEIDLDCHYRPVGLSSKVRLPGRIKDMSLGGLGMEIVTENTTSFSHMDGDLFVVETTLPNGKELELEAKIVTLSKGESSKRLILGMSITKLSAGAKSLLGFFLMPC